jgi:hypothetical protein
MTHLSHSLLPGHHTDRGQAGVKGQVGVRQEREGRLWRGLDSYVDMLAELFCKEGKECWYICCIFLKNKKRVVHLFCFLLLHFYFMIISNLFQEKSEILGDVESRSEIYRSRIFT